MSIESGTQRRGGGSAPAIGPVSRLTEAVRSARQRIGFEWLLMAACAGLWMRMQWEAGRGPHIPGFDPYLWPRMVLVLLGSVAFVLSLHQFRRTGERYAARSVGQNVVRSEMGRTATFAGLLLLYVRLMPIVGFILSTSAFLASTLWIVGRRNWKEAAIAAAGVTLVLTVLFTTVFYLPLPPGIGPFRTMSDAIQLLLVR